MSVVIEKPVQPVTKKKSNHEKWAWLFMRASGVLLVVLIFGHLFTNLWLGEGIKAIDFAFVGGKLSNPFWQVWDLLMLWLALIHGTNGMRTIVNDYVENKTANKVLTVALSVVMLALIVIGTLVIFTFDPCPAGADPSLVASFCPAS